MRNRNFKLKNINLNYEKNHSPEADLNYAWASVSDTQKDSGLQIQYNNSSGPNSS